MLSYVNFNQERIFAMIEKLSVEKIKALQQNKTMHRRWRDNIDRPFTDFTAVGEIRDVNWHFGILNYTKFSTIEFNNVDFSRSELRYADFHECTFNNCRFEGAEAQFANFSDSKFNNCIMNASLQYANFAKCNMASCMFGNSDIAFTNFEDCSFECCEALNIEHLQLANNLPTSLVGLVYDRDQYCNL